jgi:hypothetical protein
VNQLSNPPFVAKQIQGHGIGLVANRTIVPGEWLMSFTPAFMMAEDTYQDLALYDRLELQRLAFQRLPSRIRTLSENLFGQGYGGDLIDDIIISNSFGFPIIAEGDRKSGDGDSQTLYRFIFPEIAVGVLVSR